MVSLSPTAAARQGCGCAYQGRSEGGLNGLVEGGKIAFRRRARSKDREHLPRALDDRELARRAEFSRNDAMRCSQPVIRS
jgi:hypothetical protein